MRSYCNRTGEFLHIETKFKAVNQSCRVQLTYPSPAPGLRNLGFATANYNCKFVQLMQWCENANYKNGHIFTFFIDSFNIKSLSMLER